VIGKAADPQTLDPAVTIDNNDWTVSYPAYQRLVRYESKDGKGLSSVTGELSDHWTVSADGLVWEFKLKPGNSLRGPAVIHTPITTVVVQPGQVATLDGFLNLIIEG